MHRRAFLMKLVASAAIPQAMRAQTPAATPATPVTDDPRPEPLDLGDGVVLIDYRLHPGTPPGVIGELRNDSDRMIDAPVVSVTWPRDGSENGFSWLSPVIPVIDAGESIPIYGSFENGVNADATLANATFALCSSAEPGEYTMRARDLDFEIVPDDEVKNEAVYRLRGTVINTGTSTARELQLRGVVRDGNGRVTGMANAIYYTAFVVDREYSFSIYAYADPQYSNQINPFPLIEDTNYSVEVTIGTRGPTTAPGCEFGFPWGS